MPPDRTKVRVDLATKIGVIDLGDKAQGVRTRFCHRLSNLGDATHAALS